MNKKEKYCKFIGIPYKDKRVSNSNEYRIWKIIPSNKKNYVLIVAARNEMEAASLSEYDYSYIEIFEPIRPRYLLSDDEKNMYYFSKGLVCLSGSYWKPIYFFQKTILCKMTDYDYEEPKISSPIILDSEKEDLALIIDCFDVYLYPLELAKIRFQKGFFEIKSKTIKLSGYGCGTFIESIYLKAGEYDVEFLKNNYTRGCIGSIYTKHLLELDKVAIGNEKALNGMERLLSVIRSDEKREIPKDI